MNASQRARRRERRMKKRNEKRCAIFEEAVNFDKVFSYWNLLNSSYICEKGVKWKKSTQIIGIYRLTQIGKLHKDLQNAKYKKRKAYKFLLRERGKIRNISGVSFRDRIVQRTLCDNSMIPILCNGIIYDNSASQKDKGTDFSRKRFVKHFLRAIRKYGIDAYVLQYDFRHYFDSIDSESATKKILKIYNQYCKTKYDIRNFSRAISQPLLEEKGVGLGNQTSQVTAIWFPNKLDHYINEVLQCGLAGRYMDDGYAFFKNKEEAIKAKQELEHLAQELGLELHPRKTQIHPITKEITFLKTAYKWDPKNGRIHHRLCQSVLTYNRRHVHSVLHKTLSGEIDKESLVCSIESYKGVLARASKKQLRWYNYHVKQSVQLALANLEDIKGD